MGLQVGAGKYTHIINMSVLFLADYVNNNSNGPFIVLLCSSLAMKQYCESGWQLLLGREENSRSIERRVGEE